MDAIRNEIAENRKRELDSSAVTNGIAKLLPGARGRVLRALDAFDTPQQFFDLRHTSFRLVSEDVSSVDGDAHVARPAGFDFGFDTELFLRSLLQAHGRMTQVHSKETALD